MNFYSYYRNLSDKDEKRILRKQIIEACKIEPGTFYSWLHRERMPKLEKTVIAGILKMPVGVLFPEPDKTEVV